MNNMLSHISRLNSFRVSLNGGDIQYQCYIFVVNLKLITYLQSRYGERVLQHLVAYASDGKYLYSSALYSGTIRVIDYTILLDTWR